MPSRRAFLSAAGAAVAASVIPARLLAQPAGSAGEALVKALNGTDADLRSWLESYVAPASLKRQGEQTMLADLQSLVNARRPVDEVMEEAHLSPDWILKGIEKFAKARDQRLETISRQLEAARKG